MGLRPVSLSYSNAAPRRRRWRYGRPVSATHVQERDRRRRQLARGIIQRTRPFEPRRPAPPAPAGLPVPIFPALVRNPAPRQHVLARAPWWKRVLRWVWSRIRGRV